ELDAGGMLLDSILAAVASTDYPGLARGYVHGLVQHQPGHIPRVNDLLDALQPTHPRTVLDIVSTGIDVLHPLERTLALIDAGKIPVEFLRHVEFTVGNRPLGNAELREVLKRLTRAAHEGDGGAGSAAVHVLWRVLRPNGREVKPSASPEPWILALLPEVLVTLPTASNDGYAWVELVEM